MPRYGWSQPITAGGIVLHTKKYFLSNEASKFSYSINRVPFSQNKLQLVRLWAPLAVLKGPLGVEIMGNEIRRFQE